MLVAYNICFRFFSGNRNIFALHLPNSYSTYDNGRIDKMNHEKMKLQYERHTVSLLTGNMVLLLSGREHHLKTLYSGFLTFVRDL